jgi:hypothetical protein
VKSLQNTDGQLVSCMQGLKYNVQTILYELKEKEQNDMKSKIIELVYIKKEKHTMFYFE